MAELFNVATGSLEEIPDDEAPLALRSGAFVYPQGGQVNVVDRIGPGTMPVEQAAQAVQRGHIAIEDPRASEERWLEREYGDRPFTAFAEEAASAATFGLYDVAGAAIGGEKFKERRRETSARSPIASALGAGAAALVPIPGTAGSVALKAGRFVRGALAAKTGASFGGRLAAAAAGEAANGLFWGLGAGVEHVALSKEPLSAEQIVAEMGEEMLTGALIGGAVGAGGEVVSSAWSGGRRWFNAFRKSDGTQAAAGDVLERLPKRAQRQIMREEEKRLAQEASDEYKRILGERTDTVDELRGQRRRVEGEYLAAKAENQAIRDQFEAELGVLDDAGELAASRAKLAGDLGVLPIPDDALLGAAPRVHPVRRAVDEMKAAKSEVQKFFPHEGKTVSRKVGGSSQTVREFTLKMSADDIARVWNESGDAALAAVRRYEQAVINLHNALQPPGKQVTSALDFWMERSAPETLSSIGASSEALAKNAERLNRIEGAIYDLGSEPLTSAKLEQLNKALDDVRQALRGGDTAAGLKKGLAELEKVSPGITNIPDADIDAVIAASGLPVNGTGVQRDIARYHIAETRIHAASKGKVKHRGTGDVLGGQLEGRAMGVIYGAAAAKASFLGPAIVDMLRSVATGGAQRLKATADLFLGKAAKGAAAAKKAVTPVMMHLHDESKKWEERVAPIMRLSNPVELESEIRNGPAGQVAMYDPDLAVQLRDITWRKYRYLAESAPKSPLPPSPFGSYDYDPSDTEKSAFLRRAAAVEGGPARIVERVADGTVTPEEVEALQVVYPESHAAVVEYITENIAELREKLPYEKRLTLSILFGQPVEVTAAPSAVATFQAGYANSTGQSRPSSARMGSIKAPEPTAAQRITSR